MLVRKENKIIRKVIKKENAVNKSYSFETMRHGDSYLWAFANSLDKELGKIINNIETVVCDNGEIQLEYNNQMMYDIILYKKPTQNGYTVKCFRSFDDSNKVVCTLKDFHFSDTDAKTLNSSIIKDLETKKVLVTTESNGNRRFSSLEGFRPNDNLSPSETAAVVSSWTRDSFVDSFVDSWKNTTQNGSEYFRGDIKDTMAPMEVWVDKKNRIVTIGYLSLSRRDIEDLVQVGLNSRLTADEAFIEDICNVLSEEFGNEHCMEIVELEMPVTQTELENELNNCKQKALNAFNRLESAFFNAVEGVRESKIVRNKSCMRSYF